MSDGIGTSRGGPERYVGTATPVSWLIVAVYLLAFGCVFVGLENLFSQTFRECIYRPYNNAFYYYSDHQHSGQGAEGANDYASVFVIIFRAQALCSLHVIDVHNGFFALLGTVAVAVFTFTLWRSTDELMLADKARQSELDRSIKAAEDSASAARLSADAAVGVEVARLDIFGVGIASNTVFRDARMPPVNERKAVVRSINNGRTEANLIETNISLLIAPFLPVDLLYPSESAIQARIGETVAPTKVREVFTDFPYDPTSLDIPEGQFLWVRGYFDFKDFMDSHWRVEFCFFFDTNRGEFTRGDGATQAYNHRGRYDPKAPRTHIAPMKLL